MEQNIPLIPSKVLLINKPYTWSSFHVVNKIKYAVKKQFYKENPDFKGKIKPKVGHAGTLDPLATGLLIVCIGKETKNIEKYQAEDKEYTGTFFLGATTPCYDLEKEIDAHYPIDHITPEMIEEARKKFEGFNHQIPPIFSAIKVDGRRAYKIARSGKEAELKAREIYISEFKITRIALPEVDFSISCSKGTYIRSLARDFGEALHSGAHLTKLCRTRIGEFKLSDAIEIDDLEKTLSQ